MECTQIKETCLYFSDLEMAREFYHIRLGLPVIDYAPGKHIFFRAGSSVLLCFNPQDSRNKKSPPAHYASGKYHFAFEVEKDKYQHTKEEIVRKGITLIDTLVWKSGQESFYFEDPAGNVVEVVPEGIWNRP